MFSSLQEREQFYTFLMFTSRSGLFNPARKPTLFIVYDTDWASDTVGRFWRRKIFCFVSKIERSFLGRPSCSRDPNMDCDLYLLYITQITKFLCIQCTILRFTAEYFNQDISVQHRSLRAGNSFSLRNYTLCTIQGK